jgi:hypothetical protein
MPLAPVRRIVTGHNSQGIAIFEADADVVAVNPVTKNPPTDNSSPAITLIHRTNGVPVTLQGSEEEFKVENLQRSKGSGIVCQVVDISPASQGKPVHLHRNQSLDYGVILAGSIVLGLDNGVEKTLKEGDVYVQR